MHDVELIFTNAIACNEDHSEVWEDAKALQVCRFILTQNHTE